MESHTNKENPSQGHFKPERRTVDSIMEWFNHAVATIQPISPGQWLDGAMMIVAMMQEIDESLIEAEAKYRETRAVFIEEGKSAAEAETRAKASDAYINYCKLKAKKERITSFIQLAKKRTELQTWDG